MLWTETSPFIALRICSTGGSEANFTVMRAPPLKSIPYLSPPCIAILAKPATVNTSEAIMKGHFLPRKSKFVFLNNSIETCHAGVVHYVGHQPFEFVPDFGHPPEVPTQSVKAGPANLDTQ